MEFSLTVHLLDAPGGHSLQSWTFSDVRSIRVGRSLDNEIVITHPCVSRSHAVLLLENGAWRVTAISEQGVILGGRKFREQWLREGDEFRLGPAGPHLRCSQLFEQSASEHFTTYHGSALDPVALVLDKDRLTREVDAIADDDYFRKIQSSVAKIRGR